MLNDENNIVIKMKFWDSYADDVDETKEQKYVKLSNVEVHEFKNTKELQTTINTEIEVFYY